MTLAPTTAPLLLEQGRYTLLDSRRRRQDYIVTPTEVHTLRRGGQTGRLVARITPAGLVMTGLADADGHAPLLTRLTSDPVAARRRYAETTGRCGRCNRPARDLVNGLGRECHTKTITGRGAA